MAANTQHQVAARVLQSLLLPSNNSKREKPPGGFSHPGRASAILRTVTAAAPISPRTTFSRPARSPPARTCSFSKSYAPVPELPGCNVNVCFRSTQNMKGKTLAPLPPARAPRSSRQGHGLPAAARWAALTSFCSSAKQGSPDPTLPRKC